MNAPIVRSPLALLFPSLKHYTEKYIFFFSGHAPLSVTILGWSNAPGVSGNSAWRGSDRVLLSVLDTLALQLTLASSRRFVEGRKARENGETYGNRGQKGSA